MYHSTCVHKHKRIWWLVVVLLVFVTFAVWQRKLIADWLGQYAVRFASMDRVSASETLIQLAHVLDRESPSAMVASARIQRRKGDLVGFGRDLRRAESLGALPKDIQLERALAIAESGQMGTARQLLFELLETAGGNESEICESYAKGYLRQRDYNAAFGLLEAWARDFPKDARAHAWTGQVYSELDLVDEAEGAFRRALELDPLNGQASLGLAELLMGQKNPFAAMPLFEVAANTERFGAAGSVGLASCLQANSRVGQAEEVLRDALARFPDDYRVLVEAANLSNEQGEYSKAESLLEKEIALGSNRREVRYAYAVALRGLGRVDEARVHFDYSAEAATQTAEANRRAADVASRPNDARLRFEIGNIHLRYGNIEDGLIWIHSALEISPDLSHAHDSLARYYESQISRDPRYIPLARKHRLLASADNAATRKDS